MRPCVGIDGVCPPLCTMKDIDNGTYTLADIEMMNQTISEALEATIAARQAQQ